MEAGVAWALEQRQAGHPVATYCTHGHSRSAIVVCAILVASGAFKNLDAAWGRVQEARPGVHPNRRQWAALQQWFDQRQASGGSGGDGASSDLEAQPPAPPTPEPQV